MHRHGDRQAIIGLLRDAVEILRAEGRTNPIMMSVRLQMRVADHPARTAGLAILLDHVRNRDDEFVEFPTPVSLRHYRGCSPGPHTPPLSTYDERLVRSKA